MVDRVRARGDDQSVEGCGILGIVELNIFIGENEVTAVEGRGFDVPERILHLIPEAPDAVVVMERGDDVLDFDRAQISSACPDKQTLHSIGQRGVIGEQILGSTEVLEAAGAGAYRHHVEPNILSHADVPRREG